MNIFVLDLDQTTCARFHCDKHVVKMILETAQMLCTAHWCNDSSAPYKKSFENHPCAIWARATKANYEWLAKLGLELCREYTWRYDKRHSSLKHLQWLSENVPDLPDGEMTPFAQAMPEECKHEDAVVAYRTYYMLHKKHIAKWTFRLRPRWWEDEL